MKRAELHEMLIAAADECLADCDSGNPLKSWTRFIDRLDVMVRRHIGDELERQGRSRFTGEAISNLQRNPKCETVLESEDPER